VSTLERCLASIRPFVDEVDVYDTGSSDGTLDLLDRLHDERPPAAPIRVERGEWRDDFAWAREQSFALASEGTDWLFWIDADDVVEGGATIRSLIDGAPPDLDAYAVAYEIARNESGYVIEHGWRVRIVRRNAEFVWQGAAHEGLVLSTGNAARLVAVPPADLRIRHEPLPGPGDEDRNLRILMAAEKRAATNDAPLDSRTLLNLGLELVTSGLFEQAIPRLNAFVATCGATWSDERVHATHRLAACLRIGGRVAEAVRLELEAAEHRPDWTESALGLAESYATLARWPEALAWATRAVELGVPASAVLVDPVRLSLDPSLRMAEAALALGDAEGASTPLRARPTGCGHAETGKCRDRRRRLRSCASSRARRARPP
jgi:tetratricopeptide (TPR) repeat protein